MQQVILPIFGWNIHTYAKCLQLVILVSCYRRGIHASQNLNHRTRRNAFIGSRNGTQCLLHDFRSIKLTRWILANIAITAIVITLFIEVVEQDAPSAYTTLSIFAHSFEFFTIYLSQTTIVSKPFQLDNVVQGIEKHGLCRCPVSSSSTNLLIETFNALGHVIVNHPSHVALVDTHTKGNRSTNHLYLVVFE